MAAPPDTTYPLNPALSPAGREVAVNRSIDGNTDVWILDLDRSSITRVTADPGPEIVPVWSSQGESIVYSKSTGPGMFKLFRRARREGWAETPIRAETGRAIALDWSRDGRFVLFRSNEPPGLGWNIWAVSTSEPASVLPILQSRFDERTAQFSPDARWIVYESNESGRFEVYAHPFPGPGEKMAVSTSGGSRPRWSADGREIFYVSSEGSVMTVGVRATPGGLQLDAPSQLFTPRVERTVEGGIAHVFAVSADGQRFLVSELVSHPAAPVTLVLNPRH